MRIGEGETKPLIKKKESIFKAGYVLYDIVEGEKHSYIDIAVYKMGSPKRGGKKLGLDTQYHFYLLVPIPLRLIP